MNIFLSHSSKDKWAASRIAKDLESIGASVFLDEKRLHTGEHLDDELSVHLEECDDFLILFSPWSIESHWVIWELGGAQNLGKPIIPILLYVDPEEVPGFVNRRLSRDISDIDSYYDEVASRISLEIDGQGDVLCNEDLREGDKVTILGPDRNQVIWSQEMNDFVGVTASIVRINSDGTLQFDIDQGEYE
ncbi:MAG: toll/interleukin-1 receptor domain-containing protein, partial [Verrucomicrobiales bacterium]|nr:toll/interleukin-1 receptor domain-containing protein [Verrucomicrobiales bacterium]